MLGISRSQSVQVTITRQTQTREDAVVVMTLSVTDHPGIWQLHEQCKERGSVRLQTTESQHGE